MAIHAVTFRIHQDSTYQERYESVVQATRQQTSSTYWDEPTSFILIESTKNSADVAQAIGANSKFALNKDLLLVINLSAKEYTALGQVKDGDLHVLMKRR